jgi:hypothetical protein
MYLMRVGVAIALFPVLSFEAAAAPTSTSPSPRPVQERTIRFAWNPSPDRSVVSYKIYWGTGSRNYQQVRELKPIQRTELTLPSNTTYYVAVSACNMVGESRLSNEVIVSAAGPGSDN